MRLMQVDESARRGAKVARTWGGVGGGLGGMGGWRVLLVWCVGAQGRWTGGVQECEMLRDSAAGRTGIPAKAVGRGGGDPYRMASHLEILLCWPEAAAKVIRAAARQASAATEGGETKTDVSSAWCIETYRSPSRTTPRSGWARSQDERACATKRKRRGERGQPCRTPACHRSKALSTPFACVEAMVC